MADKGSAPPPAGGPAGPGQGPPKKGGLIGLIKRKPLETIGAAAAVVGIGFLWWQHHQSASAQNTPGTTGATFRAPGFGPGGGGSGNPGDAAIDRQLEQQLANRDRRRRQHNPRPGRNPPPTNRRPPRRTYGGGGPPRHRRR